MPLAIDTNINRNKVLVLPSDIVEIIALVNILVDDKHHEYAMDLSKLIYNGLTNNSKQFLKDIYYLPYQGLEFYELILSSRIFNDLEKLIHQFLSYKDDKFIFILTGEQISLAEISIFKKDRKKYKAFLKEAPWLVRENTIIFEHIMYRTQEFKESLAELLRDVQKNIPDKKLIELQMEYSSSIEEVNLRLKKASPLELMQEFMDKKIDYKSEIIEYIFIPSYFIRPHYLMGFDKSSRLMVYDVRLSKAIHNTHGEQITEMLKVISDKTRLEILRLIILQPTYGKLLADRLNLTTATISHHLELLLNQGLIKEQKSKNIKYFSANLNEIERVLTELKNYLFNN